MTNTYFTLILRWYHQLSLYWPKYHIDLYLHSCKPSSRISCKITHYSENTHNLSIICQSHQAPKTEMVLAREYNTVTETNSTFDNFFLNIFNFILVFFCFALFMITVIAFTIVKFYFYHLMIPFLSVYVPIYPDIPNMTIISPSDSINRSPTLFQPISNLHPVVSSLSNFDITFIYIKL